VVERVEGGAVHEGDDAGEDAGGEVSDISSIEQLVQKCKDKKFMQRCSAFMEKIGTFTGDRVSNTVLKRLHGPLNAAVTKMWSDALCSPTHRASFVEFFNHIAGDDEVNSEKRSVEFFNMCFSLAGKVGLRKGGVVDMWCGCVGLISRPSITERLCFGKSHTEVICGFPNRSTMLD
jgi:hypothetical protein